MPVEFIGEPQQNKGEQYVFAALKRVFTNTNDDCLIFHEPKLIDDNGHDRFPDFVIVHQDWGVMVLEVKGWVDIEEADSKRAKVVRQKTGNPEWETSPTEQARQAMFILINRLAQEDDLRNISRGKFKFPYHHAGVLPFLQRDQFLKIKHAWGEKHVLGQDDLESKNLYKVLKSFPKRQQSMTLGDIDAIRAIINRHIILKDKSGGIKGITSREQDSLARTPLASTSKAKPVVSQQTPLLLRSSEELAAEIPASHAETAKSNAVMLVRGYAGTGKTDVLLLRARYLYEQNPDIRILVTTFNKRIEIERLKPALTDLHDRVDVGTFDSLCNTILRKRDDGHPWISPQNTEGVIAKMKMMPELQEFFANFDEDFTSFLSEEFSWMKDTHRTTREMYVKGIREGRSSKQRRQLNKQQKESIFTLFEHYQAQLKRLNKGDWNDYHFHTLEYLKSDVQPDQLYDVIMIDEAQHFAPDWISIINYFLKPDGELFLCDDPSQSVYKQFSWKQKGVQIVGRTKWLRVPYRNTQQIFEAAYALIQNNSEAQKLLQEDTQIVQPDLESTQIPQGPKPEQHTFLNVDCEIEFVLQTIQHLINEHYLTPNDICILHDKPYVLKRFESFISGTNVRIEEAKKITGMEYKAVIIPRAHEVGIRGETTNWIQDESKLRAQFYTMMTRARRYLYILHGKTPPKILSALKGFVETYDHTASSS